MSLSISYQGKRHSALAKKVYKRQFSRYNSLMMTYKLIALSFIVTTPIVAGILSRLLGLKRFGIGWPDLSVLLFAGQIYLLSSRFFTHSFLPHYLLMLASIAFLVALGLLLKTRDFRYRRFIKFFWRISFIATIVFYLATLVSLFLKK